MRRRIKGPEYSAPPPEEYAAGAELSPAPELEFAALPPEYGQGTAPAAEAGRRRSPFLRSMLIIPLLTLLLSLFFGNGAGTTPEQPGGTPPAETGATLPGSAETSTPQTEETGGLPPQTEETGNPLPATEAGPPELHALLEVFPDGSIEFTATLLPRPGDQHSYDLQVDRMGQRVYRQEEVMGLSLGDDARELPVTGSSAAGYTMRYAGGSAAASIPADARLSVYVVLLDRSTGETYEVESNQVNAVPPVEPEPETYPLTDGQIVITVYNDTMTFDVPSPVENEGWLTLLAVDSFSAEEFTEYALPEPIAPAGYDFLGWVIHVNNPFDLGSEENLFQIYEGDPPVDILTAPDRCAFPVGNTLTRENLARVPPDENGDRFVNVHAAWVRRDPGEPLLFLDDGMGSVTSYGMDVPMASEGYLYLCRYPVPEREDWVFTGWYDADGNRVDLLVCYFSFTPMQYNEAGDFLGYDWSRSQPVYLYAGWRPAP